METISFYLLAGITTLFLAGIIIKVFYQLVKKKVGDCAIQWADGYLKIEEPVYKSEWDAFIEFALPVKSIGKQQCIMVELFGRIQPEGDKYNILDNQIYVYPGGNRRNDRYWEACLIKPGDTMIIKGELTLHCQDRPIKDVMKEFRYLDIAFYYKYYCRSPVTAERKVIRLDLSQFVGNIEETDRELYITRDEGKQVLPIRTPLLVPGDDLYYVFGRYVKSHLKEGDILAVCESALAIMEGRVYYYEDIKPGFLATHLNKMFKMDSSLSSVYSLEMGIREVGTPRILFSVLMGALGKLIGRAGDFYLYAGRAVATIDDCTGTLPPFDKCVVMGPKNPKETVVRFKEKTGVDLAVVDVNDLGKVDVLAVSGENNKERVVAALKTNPQGNGNEQTPIALIRKS